MNNETVLHHIALQHNNRKQAELFFNKILGLTFKKTFTISKELSNNIFGIKKEVLVDVYYNEKTYIEIFISKIQKNHGFIHTCIEINNKEEFIKRCKKYDIEPILVKKGEKTILFIRDYAKNLFEIKEIQT